MRGKLKQFCLSTPGLWLVFITWTLFVSNLWLPRNWGFYGTEDWDLTYSTFEVARKSIVEYHQWPSFNPFCAFGSDLDANPQAGHASIFFIPIWLFGSFYGYKLSIIVAILLGCWGAFRLFNTLNPDKFTSLSMALIFAGCSYFSRHIFQAGHSNVLYFYLLPWLIYYLNRLLINIKPVNIVWPVLILSQMIAGGAPFVFIASSLLICLWGIGLFWIEKKGLKPLSWFFLIIVLSIALSAWKVWPVLQFWEHMPRLVKDESGINLLVWTQALADIETDTRTPHQWHEFAMGFSLVLLGLILYYFKEIPHGKKWLLIFGLIIWLSLGNMPEYLNPWYLLNNYVPFFTSLRAPYRFGILIVFVLCIVCAKVVKDKKDNKLIYIVLLFTTVIQALTYNSISKKVIGSPRIEDFRLINSHITPISKTLDQDKSQFMLISQNYLVQNAYEPLTLSPVTDSMKTMVSGGELNYFSPHRIKITPTDKEVSVALRYSTNWQIKGNGRLLSGNGLLHIENSDAPFELIYENKDLKTGIIISLLTLGLLISISLAASRRKSN